jgi:hypothetical protein
LPLTVIEKSVEHRSKRIGVTAAKMEMSAPAKARVSDRQRVAAAGAAAV